MFIKITFAYCLLIIYVSTVVSPGGFHFVPIDLGTAWRRFIQTPYQIGGPDIRADWNSNLLMFVPLGIMTTAALWPRQPGLRRGFAVLEAFTFCLVFLLAVKFVQLFFPGRTVSISYIIAQSLGALIGVTLFIGFHHPLMSERVRLLSHGRTALSAALRAYALVLLAFMLFPFDFVLSRSDLHERLAQLPSLLVALPGEGRPLPWRLAFIVASTLETLPLGILIALYCRRRRVLAAGAIGLGGMAAVGLLQILILSAAPSALAILYHTLGIVAGAIVAGAIDQLALIRWRLNLARAIPSLALIYLLALLLTNDLVAVDWRSPMDAWTVLGTNQLLPFYHAYVVSKAHAVVSVAAHAAMYAPIGIMIWLRRGSRPGGHYLALALALILSFAVEVGRWFRPELLPDFTNLIIAGVAAPLAIPLSAWVWRVLEESFPTAGLPPASVLTAAAERVMRSPPAVWRPLSAWWRVLLATACGALAVGVLARYPLAPWPLALALSIYAAALFRWPVIWLAVIPAVLPALDLAPWTGWLYVGESDLFIVVTVGVLLLRAPPGRADLALGKVAAAAVLLSCAVYVLSIIIGLWFVPAVPTDNPYLSAWNGLRVAKGFFAALALFPFLSQAIRSRANALVWLGAGMIAGLIIVATATMIERSAFVGLFDFTSDYRAVATFSSMHVGGGHLGTYLAMAIPFLSLCLLKPRPGIPTGLVLAAVAGYALAVTYSRTGYAAALAATAVVCLGWTIAGDRAHRRPSALIAPLIGALAVAIGMGAVAVGSTFMHGRLVQSADDLTTREDNWAHGLAVRDPGPATWLLGMGLGTYPRVFRARAASQPVGSNFLLGHDADGNWLEITAGAPSFYFGQKVAATTAGAYTVTFAFRSPNEGGSVTVGLCEKLLLYSDHCSAASFKASAPGKWVQERAALRIDELAPPLLFGWMRRPVELYFHVPQPGATVEISTVRLLDPRQNQLVRNGDFAQGTARWFFTDDGHANWRIFNEYLMLLFEQGVLGVIAHVLLAATAFLGLWRAIISGNRAAAPLAAALLAYLGAGLLESLLEAPRLSTLFYLLCFAGLAIPVAPDRRPREAGT